MQQDHVADLTGDLGEVPALLAQPAELAGHQAFGMLAKVVGDDRNRVAGDEGTAAARLNIGPDDNGQQALLGSIEVVYEPVAVLVPAGYLG